MLRSILPLLFTTSLVLAQGSLTPPAPPGPTMKTLDQIEPRTPISALPYTISAPGSYYLTKNLAVASGGAITVAANDVTIDLNGFAISSTADPQNGTAIDASDATNVTVVHGHIVSPTDANGGWADKGFAVGIFGANHRAYRVADVTVSGASLAIQVGETGSIVESCSVFGSSSSGISGGAISRCTVVNGTNDGITALSVSDSHAEVKSGIAISSYTVSNSVGFSTGSGAGILAVTVANSTGSSTSGPGVAASQVTNSNGLSTSGVGLDATLSVADSSGESFVTSGTAGGLHCGGVAENSVGRSHSNGVGLYAEKAAHNCNGISDGSGTGLVTSVAFNCYGTSGSGTGVIFTKIGAMCWGERVNPPANDYVLGGGLKGQVSLP